MLDHPIRAARKRAGLTLRRVDEYTEIDFRRLHLFELGLEPSPIEKKLLAACLRVRPGELFPAKDRADVA